MLLTYGDQRATVDLRGGRLLTYDVAGTAVLTHEPLPDERFRSSLLVPWPSRVSRGRWNWQGRTLQLPVNELPLGAALHGLVHLAPFTVDEHGARHVRLVHDLAPSAGYPFPLRVTATYQLGSTGLIASLSATATGSAPTPVALGVHPYLDTRGPVDDTVLTIPARRRLALDTQWEETGRPEVSSTWWDLRSGRRLGQEAIDACWTDLPAPRMACRLEVPGGDSVVLWGGPTCRYVVVYSGDGLEGAAQRRALALEPNTAPPNALRSGVDLDVLEPGETLTLDWGLVPSWLAPE